MRKFTPTPRRFVSARPLLNPGPVSREDEVLKLETQLHLEQFLKSVERAPRSLLLLDYDGTLAPFREERDQAFPFPGVAPLLQEIVRGGPTRVVIISGRDARETVPLLGVTPIPEVWGLHGLQRRRPDGSIETVRIENDHLDALSEAYRWLDDQQLVHTAEIKTGSIAVHWRGLEDHEVEHLRSRVLLGWKTIAKDSGMELLHFDGGIEIRIAEADKGDVVRLVLNEEEAGIPAAYLGDDATDEHAFQAICGRGLGVLVRPHWRPTAAQLWLKPPEELFDFLTRWLEAVRRRGSMGGATATAVSR
jgi:trehalose 6-phosphate phosphatase